MTEQVEPILARAEEPKQQDLGAAQPGRYPRPAEGAREVQSPEVSLWCVACGEHHGSQGEELGCLRSEIKRLRGT